jgi:hypothetical protein
MAEPIDDDPTHGPFNPEAEGTMFEDARCGRIEPLNAFLSLCRHACGKPVPADVYERWGAMLYGRYQAPPER